MKDRLPRNRARTLGAMAAALVLAGFALLACRHQAAPSGFRFALTFPAERSDVPLDGRLLLLLSTNDRAEPRFQISDGPQTGLVFGVDVDGWAPGAQVFVDA
jgi:hypothetical protein